MVTTLNNSIHTEPPWCGASFVRENVRQKQTVSVKPLQVYNRARYYDPATGEFISRDPLEYVDGMSLYRAYFVPGDIDPEGTSIYLGTNTCRPGDGCTKITNHAVAYTVLDEVDCDDVNSMIFWGGISAVSGQALKNLFLGAVAGDAVAGTYCTCSLQGRYKTFSASEWYGQVARSFSFYGLQHHYFFTGLGPSGVFPMAAQYRLIYRFGDWTVLSTPWEDLIGTTPEADVISAFRDGAYPIQTDGLGSSNV